MLMQSLLQRYWPYFSPAAILAILFAAGAYIVATLPPRTIVMATGPEGGANYELGGRYRQILAKSGIDLKLLPTSGSVENLRLLRDPKSGVSVALLQDGAAEGAETSGVEALGTVGYEPLWLFRRTGIGGTLGALAGKRVSIGPEGSGARAFALDILKRTKIEGTIGELLGFPPLLAAAKLIAGDIDAAFLVTGWDSPAVQSLVNANGVELTSYERADAMVTLYPFLTKVVLPRGIFDLANDRPSADIQLLASKSILAVRADVHSALQYLLLTAATEIHSRSGIFQKAEQFPIAESVDLPLSADAERFHRSGRPFLQEQLPFWFAVLIGKALVVLVPLAAVTYPIFRLVPLLYDWMMRSKIDHLYGEMRSVENTMEDHVHDLDAPAMMARIDELEQRAIHLRVPTSYDGSLYTVRIHIGLIRSHLESILANAAPPRADNEQPSGRCERPEFSPGPLDPRSADR
jgi:TRAP transporter TAXI family solute receptor